MRVLWFSGNSSLYKSESNIAGGWICSLEDKISKTNKIELGISFPHIDKCFKSKGSNGVVYYPISQDTSSIKSKIKKYFFRKQYDEEYLKLMKKVIKDFKPDIIHVWGSEMVYGQICKYTEIPIVIHIQGILTPCINSWFPPGYSFFSLFYYSLPNIKRGIKYILDYINSKYASEREREVYSHVKHYIGRTEWDYNVTKLYAPKSEYYYCSEIIRKEFYQSPIWYEKERTIYKFTTISLGATYKGIDTILKTSKLLKRKYQLNFEWKIIGTTPQMIKVFERKTRIKASDNNIICCGRMDIKNVIKELLDSNIYIHPTYIDNSPNSICEAQILGVPTISTYIGGIPSLINHKENGILVPPNDPYQLASYIHKLLFEKELTKSISEKGHQTALNRHNSDVIIESLINIYKTIININNKYGYNN